MPHYKIVIPVLLLPLFIAIFYQNCSQPFTLTQSAPLNETSISPTLLKFEDLPDANSLLKSDSMEYQSFNKLKGNLLALQSRKFDNLNVIIYDLTDGKAIDIFLGCGLINHFYLEYLLIRCEDRLVGYNPEEKTSKVFFRHTIYSTYETFTYKGELYFGGNGATGRELYKYNSQTGVELVKDINPNGNGYPGEFTEYNGQLFFHASGDKGSELYKYDPQTGIELVKDINPNGQSQPRNFTEYNGELFFSASGATGNELYKYNSQTGVELVKDIRPNEESGFPRHLTEHNGELYFIAYEAASNLSLFKYHPEYGVKTVEDKILDSLNSLNLLINYNDELYFTSMSKLYKYNSKTGVELVADLSSRGISFVHFRRVYNDGLYFLASDGEVQKIFKYNLQNGIQEINFVHSEIDYNPKNFTEFDDSLFYASRYVGGVELYKYQPQSSSKLIKDLSPEGDSYPSVLFAYNGELYFRATTTYYDFTMYKYHPQNGVEKVTHAELNNISSESEYLNYKGEMFFSGTGDMGDGLYKYHPQTGVTLVENINSKVSSHPKNFTEYNGELFFSATSETGDEIYKYHPNTGVQLVKDIKLSAGSEAKDLTVFNGELYLRYTTERSKFLYKYNSSGEFVYSSYYPNHNAGNVAVASKTSFNSGLPELFLGPLAPQTPEIFKSDKIIEITSNVFVNNRNYILGIDALNRGRLYVYSNSSFGALLGISVDVKSINKIGSSLLIFYKELGSAEIKAKILNP